MDNSKKPNKENPRKSANCLSVLFITWLWPLIYKGSKTGLTQEDLTKTLNVDESEQLGNELEKEWKKQRQKSKRNDADNCLRNAVFKTYYKSFICSGLLKYIFVTGRTISALIVSQLLKKYQSLVVLTDNVQNGTTNTYKITELDPNNYTSEDRINVLNYIWNDVTWLTTLLVLFPFIAELSYHQFELRQKLMGSRIRVACCSMIYRKILRLSKKSSKEATVGYVVSLLSNDVSRLDCAFMFTHYLWITPVQSIIICYILYGVIGPAAFVGVLCLLLQLIPIQSFLSKLTAKLRLKVAVRTDKRIGIMNELINGIMVVKMYGWEIPFQAVVAKVRSLEIKQIRHASFIIGAGNSSFSIVERFTLFITIVAMLYFNIPISADIVFSLAIYYNLLQLVGSIGFTYGLSALAEGLVSIKRIEQFLKLDERDPALHGVRTAINSLIQPNEIILEVNDVTASWTDTRLKKTLDGVNFNAIAGKLCAVIGPVGAGKSSILQLILGELPIQSGNIVVKGNISYGSQKPWLFTGSVKNNILFGQTFNKKRYDEVTKRCALITDFNQLQYGDQTLVGDRGASLSGGQKARISLARAVYKTADIYLMDDPLSAVDAHVGRHLYEEVIGPDGFLAKTGATRILATHQVHFLQVADWIIVMKDGKILQQGTYQEHANSGLDIIKLLEDEYTDEENQTDENTLKDEHNEETPLTATNQISRTISRSDMVSTDISMHQSIQSLYESPEAVKEVKSEGVVSLKVWVRYFRGGGSICYLSYVAFLFVFSQIVSSVCDYFVNIWTQQEFLRANHQITTYTTEECLYIYSILIAGVIFFVMLRCFLFFIICMRASKTLHNNMFAAILHAPMRFFDTNSSGQILNRFSRDMGNIDELFPRSLFQSLKYFFLTVGIFAVIVFITPIILIALGIAIILYILLTRIYVRPAQDLKRLEGVTRSLVLGHMTATLNGLTTIRVNKAQSKVAKEFDELQNVHTNVWQLIHVSSSAYAFWLDMISCTFVSFVAFSFVLFKDNKFAGNVGLAISQSLNLTEMLQYGIRICTESVQLMTSVERVLEYCDLKPEHSPSKQPSEKWPVKGEIVFEEMSYSYDVNLPPALNKIKIKIHPGWKVGVVGRTGAGKSSLIGALFRLAHIDGRITIDDVDTGEISLKSLRQNITIIPQDPVLFSATIRYNLDPFDLHTDDQLWKVLEVVELKAKIGQLSYLVTEGGSNFSVGERQLLCLARAILRNNNIFVLDEATANVDPQTDILIQKTIRDKFVNRTVITIAHRLHTVMDSDRILVMDAGVAKEFDMPHILLQNKNRYLSNMLTATGENESEALRKIAAVAFNKYEKNTINKKNL